MNYKEILDNFKNEIAGMLSELVSFRSVNAEAKEGKPFGEEVHKAYRYMLERAERDGFGVFDADGFGGHIEWVGMQTDESGEIIAVSNETLGVAVHLDVVPAGDGWVHDPWGGELSGGRIYGRGTSDNKGAAVIVYFAMKALKDSGYVPSKNVRLILGLDEEGEWLGIDRYLEQVAPPDFGFTPDANFPVINGEKGILVFELAKKFEPGNESGLFLRSMKGGDAANMVPGACRAILVYEEGAGEKSGKAGKKRGKTAETTVQKEKRENAFALVKEAAAEFRRRTGARLLCKGAGSALEVQAEGVPAHGSLPEKGLNAISVMMDFLSGLPISNESARDFVDFYHGGIGYETDGDGLGIKMSDRLSGSMVVNAGMIDLSREAVVLTMNVRYPVSKNEEDVYGALRPVLDREGLGVIKKLSHAPLYYPPDEPFVSTLLEVYRENTGDTQSLPIVIGAGTYARAFPRSVAFGTRFPGEDETAHEKDEYADLNSMMRAAHIYADAIYRLTQEGFVFEQHGDQCDRSDDGDQGDQGK